MPCHYNQILKLCEIIDSVEGGITLSGCFDPQALRDLIADAYRNFSEVEDSEKGQAFDAIILISDFARHCENVRNIINQNA